MYKRIGTIILIIFGALLIWVYHAAVFNPAEINIFGNKIDLSKYFKNYYVKYSFNKNQDPIYVWKDKLFTDYNDYCHQNKKNCLIFPHQQSYIDLIWINSIQYVGNTGPLNDSRFLYSLLDNITNLNLYWTYPYVFGEILIPLQKNAESSLKEISWQDAVSLGEKAKKYNCDLSKVSNILGISDIDLFDTVISKNSKFNENKNPCKIYDIVNFLGFNYYYYLKNDSKAAENYKLSSFHEDSPKASLSMISVVSSNLGEYEKSMQLRINQFSVYNEKLEKSLDNKESGIYESKVDDSLKRALNQLQYMLVLDADNSNSKCLHDYNCLLKKGFLKKSINNLYAQCAKLNPKDISIENLGYKTNELSGNILKIKCVLLLHSLKNGYIQEHGDLVYPFNAEGKKGVFYWNEERGAWRIILK